MIELGISGASPGEEVVTAFGVRNGRAVARLPVAGGGTVERIAFLVRRDNPGVCLGAATRETAGALTAPAGVECSTIAGVRASVVSTKISARTVPRKRCNCRSLFSNSPVVR